MKTPSAIHYFIHLFELLLEPYASRLPMVPRHIGIRILVILLSSLTLSCERPLENPELADNIYNDLLKETKLSTSEIESEKKVLAGLEEDIVATKLGDNSGKSKFRKKYETETKIQLLKQKAQFYELRALKRKIYIGEAYPKYFEKRLHWPDAEEWANYQSSKRLSTASRDWGQRVPRLGKRIKAYSDSAAAAYSGAKKEGAAKKPPDEKEPPAAPKH